MDTPEDWRVAMPDRPGIWATICANDDGTWGDPLVVDVLSVESDGVQTRDSDDDGWWSRTDTEGPRRRWRWVGPAVPPPAEKIEPLPPPPKPRPFEVTLRRTAVQEAKNTITGVSPEEVQKFALRHGQGWFSAAHHGTIEVVSVVEKEGP